VIRPGKKPCISAPVLYWRWLRVAVACDVASMESRPASQLKSSGAYKQLKNKYPAGIASFFSEPAECNYLQAAPLRFRLVLRRSFSLQDFVVLLASQGGESPRKQQLNLLSGDGVESKAAHENISITILP